MTEAGDLPRRGALRRWPSDYLMTHACLALHQMATAGDTDVQWRALAGLYCSTACALDWTLEEALRRPLVVRVLSRAMDAYEPDRLDPGDDNHRNTIHMELERRRSRVPLAG